MMKKKGVMKKKSEEKGFWVDSLIETMEKLHPWIRTPVSSSNYHTLFWEDDDDEEEGGDEEEEEEERADEEEK